MWVCPSRSRPHNVERLLKAFWETGARPCIILGLDDDDPMLGGYPSGFLRVQGARRPLSAIYNEVFDALPALDWYGVLADDVVPETRGWDRALIDAAGSDGLAFGDDGINGPDHATHFVLGGDLVREFGGLALPGLDRTFIDTAWNHIARRRGVLQYLPEVKLTHMHYSNRTALMDATYRKHHKAEDRIIYNDWKQDYDHGNP